MAERASIGSVDDLLVAVRFAAGHQLRDQVVVVAHTGSQINTLFEATLGRFEQDPAIAERLVSKVALDYPNARVICLAFDEAPDAPLGRHALGLLQEACAAGLPSVRDADSGAVAGPASFLVRGENWTLTGVGGSADLASGVFSPDSSQLGGYLSGLAADPYLPWMNARERLDAIDPGLWADRAADLVTRGVADPAALSESDLAELGACVNGSASASRLAALAVDDGNAANQGAVWSKVVDQCPEEFRIVPLSLVALAAFMTDNKPLVSHCGQQIDQLAEKFQVRARPETAKIITTLSRAANPRTVWSNLKQRLQPANPAATQPVPEPARAHTAAASDHSQHSVVGI
jgi:hypothetical protein